MKKILSLIVAVCLCFTFVFASACTDGGTASGSDSSKESVKHSGTSTAYTVTFDACNGTDPIVLSVDKDGKIQFPADPVKDHAVFKGWYTGKGGSGLKITETYNVTYNMKAYAKWEEAESVTVTFDLNYSGARSQFMDVYLNTTISELPTPARTCYDFVGWNTRSDGTGTTWTTSSIVDKRMTLFAQWNLEAGHVHNYQFTKNVPTTCEKEGYDLYTCLCGAEEKRNVQNPLGHDFGDVDKDEFLKGYLCLNGCGEIYRNESERIYDESLEYTLTDAKCQEIKQLGQDMIKYIETVEEYDEALHGYVFESELYIENRQFEHDYFDKFVDGMDFVADQYDCCYIFYCINNGKNGWSKKYQDLVAFYNDLVTVYYSAFAKIHATKYREYFFSYDDGWTDEDIAQALVLSEKYGGGEFAEIQTRLKAIEVQSDAMDVSSDSFLSLYEEFVTLSNQVAEMSGYENYFDYAYENVFSRDYSPEQTATMRNYFKKHLKSLLGKINTEKGSIGRVVFNADDKKMYADISETAVYESFYSANYIADYFKTLTINGKKKINYYDLANQLMKEGRYFTGAYEGAYTTWVDTLGMPVIYYGPESYSAAFTFVHEFGHYCNFIYNEQLSLSYDLDETHSQGNEFLFLAYLKDALGEGKADVFRRIENDQFYNAVAILVLTAAIDEFEYAVYNNYSDLKAKYKDGITKDEYQSLYDDILATYGLTSSMGLNTQYWRYMTIGSAAYSISYGLSLIPCLELYIDAMENGLESASEKYLKLISFTDADGFTRVDSEGDVVLDATYVEILNYAGLSNPFEESVYEKIARYFELA